MKCRLLLVTLCCAVNCAAQDDPEFPKGGVMYLSARQGVNTSFDADPDLYVVGIDVSPQVTVIPAHLRLGASLGFAFTNKEFSGLAGPALAWKIKTLQVKPLGSVLNIQLQLEHLWGTHDERLAGMLLGIEFIQALNFQLMAHRDHHNERWWFRAGLGYNLLRKKRKSVTGTDPMR